MKIEGQTTFSPVTITLESQDEVDQVYAIAVASKKNHSLIKGLRPHRTFSGYHKFYNEIRKKRPRCACSSR